MRRLRYSINLTLDGCCDHRAIQGGPELHRHAAAWLAQADALLFGRVTYQMMESAWRLSADQAAAEAEPGEDPFPRTIHGARKYVVSRTLDSVDWNAEVIRGDVRTAVEALKAEPGTGIATGGVQLPRALAELGLIDEYEFIMHPVIAGHGPALFAGLPRSLELTLVGRTELDSGAVALQYVPRAEAR